MLALKQNKTASAIGRFWSAASILERVESASTATTSAYLQAAVSSILAGDGHSGPARLAVRFGNGYGRGG
jgi:hypothetical protein